MIDTSILDRVYHSTFTPWGETEESKTCPGCKRLLVPVKFKCRKGSRGGIQGIIRNEKCRRCESEVTEERKGERTSRIESTVEDLTHESSQMKEEFNEAISLLREDLDDVISENKRLRRDLEDLQDEFKKSLRNNSSSLTDTIKRSKK